MQNKRRAGMSKQFISQELNDELMLYNTDKEEVHVLNPTARMIYNLIQQGKSKDEMLKIIQETFHMNDIKILKKDIDDCIEQFKTKKLFIAKDIKK